MLVDAVKDSLVGAQIKRNERKNAGQRFGVHGGVHIQLIKTVGGSRDKALFLLVKGGFDVNEP